MKTIAKRMMVAANVTEDVWPWAMEYAALIVRKRALKPSTTIIPFGDMVVVKPYTFGKKGWGKERTGWETADVRPMDT